MEQFAHGRDSAACDLVRSRSYLLKSSDLKSILASADSSFKGSCIPAEMNIFCPSDGTLRVKGKNPFCTAAGLIDYRYTDSIIIIWISQLFRYSKNDTRSLKEWATGPRHRLTLKRFPRQHTKRGPIELRYWHEITAKEHIFHRI